MTDRTNGPPTNDEAQAGQDLGDIEKTGSDTNKPRVYRRRGAITLRHAPQDIHSQLERRRAAAQRHVPLDCGCRDPWPCRCSEPPLSDNAIEGWRAAIERTLPIGPPVVPVEVLQRLYRNGGTDRQLAQRVWHETGGRVA